jgi:hypothetical protein
MDDGCEFQKKLDISELGLAEGFVSERDWLNRTSGLTHSSYRY